MIIEEAVQHERDIIPSAYLELGAEDALNEEEAETSEPRNGMGAAPKERRIKDWLVGWLVGVVLVLRNGGNEREGWDIWGAFCWM